MGKYMKKGKITSDVAVMELSQSPLGVRTRAKTLAIQRLQSAPPESDSDSQTSYLQLRSRRLEKHTPFHEDRKKSSNANVIFAQKWNLDSASRLRLTSLDSSSAASVSIIKGYDAEASFGENNLEFEARDRSTRENTPCSLIREADIIKIPSSTRSWTNPPTTRAQSTRASVLRDIPSAEELNEFFAYAEQQQQCLFVEKYNFDIVNDLPLPGRYEWVRVSE